MSYRNEDTLYPEVEYYDPEAQEPGPEYEPDPDRARDLILEQEWKAEALADDDPRPFGWGGKTGGYVDEYMTQYSRTP